MMPPSLTLLTCFAAKAVPTAIPIVIVTPATYSAYLRKQKKAVAAYLEASRFQPEVGRCIAVHGSGGEIEHWLAIVPARPDPWAIGGIAARLGEGSSYQLDFTHSPKLATRETRIGYGYGWGLAVYQFLPFRKDKPAIPRLIVEDAGERREIVACCTAAYLARDLINLPANHLGPQELIRHALDVAKQHKAEAREFSGERLLKENYPAVFAVGKASTNSPGIVDIRWGNPKHPKLTLVGKGVTFDSGGLDIKPAAAMKMMKKDMGGAAVLLGLAKLIMEMKLPVRLRLLIPAVENSIAGNAFRPMDIINTRAGLTVEIGNTDAEGRLILADALCEADSEQPDLLIDCATLTGAARVAVGTDMPAFFTPDDALAESLSRAGQETGEPVWRLPLHEGYADLLESKIADLNNAPDTPYAGAITAALFLQRFVKQTPAWVHLDMMAWNIKPRPGRPVGGEAQALRALYRLVQERLGVSS